LEGSPFQLRLLGTTAAQGCATDELNRNKGLHGLGSATLIKKPAKLSRIHPALAFPASVFFFISAAWYDQPPAGGHW